MKKRRKEMGIPVEDIAKTLNISVATVYRYENGDIEKVPGTILEPLAQILCTTPAYLMGWNENSTREQHILGIIPMPEMRKIPLLGTIACGEPILAAENIEQEVDMPVNIKADFALRCKGDSMIGARINDGDIVYIRKQCEVYNGQIAAVLIGEEATLKRVYYYPEKLVLNPENPAYEPMIYVGSELEDVKILGLAVSFTSAL